MYAELKAIRAAGFRQPAQIFLIDPLYNESRDARYFSGFDVEAATQTLFTYNPAIRLNQDQRLRLLFELAQFTFLAQEQGLNITTTFLEDANHLPFHELHKMGHTQAIVSMVDIEPQDINVCSQACQTTITQLQDRGIAVVHKVLVGCTVYPREGQEWPNQDSMTASFSKALEAFTLD